MAKELRWTSDGLRCETCAVDPQRALDGYLCALEKCARRVRSDTPAFENNFFGAGSLAVSVRKRAAAEKLEWGDIGIIRSQRSYVDHGRYVPSDIYEPSRGRVLGIALALEQKITSEDRVWHLHQDLVIALGLFREADAWVRPDEGYAEVALITRDPNGRPNTLNIKTEFLRDYLCARKMGLVVSSYFSRMEIVEDAGHFNWEGGAVKEVLVGGTWEGRITEIIEGGWPSEDVVIGCSGRKLFRVHGELWRNEWIAPGERSPRVKGDRVTPGVSFIVDASGRHETAESLGSAAGWLWFRPEVISALIGRRGGTISWFTRDTGSVGCTPGHPVHFGVNALGLINVFAKHIASLPEWQQRVWAGFNVTPEGGVSDELWASQMEVNPARTKAPENILPGAMKGVDEAFVIAFGKPLFREHVETNSLFASVYRFRATDQRGVCALAKDLARLILDRIDVAALHTLVKPPKGEKWASLWSLQNVLTLRTSSDHARAILTCISSNLI
jgi:hypothetical protein